MRGLEDGGALDRMLLTRETAALEVAEVVTGAEGALRGVGALMGVGVSDGAAGEGPVAAVVEDVDVSGT